MHVVLIGPIGAGKSTVAPFVAAALGRAVVELDVRRSEYYADAGYDTAEADRRRSAGGFQALYEYWKPFEIDAVERLIRETDSAVLDFGAGHSVYEDPTHFARAQRALGPQAVVLILPSADIDESLDVLDLRASEDERGFVRDINANFIRHPSNALLADITVHTLGHTPEETADEIVRRVTPVLATGVAQRPQATSTDTNPCP